MRFVLSILIAVTVAQAFPFSLIKKETDTAHSPTLLVIGGIHGNEPGSYFATALLSHYYTIKKGNLWIIPDLNRRSIQQNSRGIYGDLNRKFATIDPDDPDFDVVDGVKKIITEPQIGLILNLHDGHGFYRKQYLNTIFNPNAWGQTCVIDQKNIDATDLPFSNLNEIASNVSHSLNNGLLEHHHSFDVRNTNTRFDDEAMQHSLTYFAVSHNKPAFAIETSKNLPTLYEKIFYQLRAIECYMTLMGIEYERPFPLDLSAIQTLTDDYGNLTINNNFYLILGHLRNNLSFIPLQSINNDFKFSHVLGSVQKNKQCYDLYIGNKKIGSLSPDYQKKEDCLESVSVVADGQSKSLTFATDFFVTDDFKIVNNNPKIRVNVIGFSPKGIKDESNLRLGLQDLDSKYSIDTLHKSYRIEFYREDRFCGMVLVHFKEDR